MKEKILDAIERFHDKFFPEVKVTYLGSNKEMTKHAFLFAGSFCLTCGLVDYFDDFAQELSKVLGRNFMVEDKLPLGEGYHMWVVVISEISEIPKKHELIRFKIVDPRTKLAEEVAI